MTRHNPSSHDTTHRTTQSVFLRRVVEVELRGTGGLHHDVEQPKLPGGEGADHHAPRGEAFFGNEKGQSFGPRVRANSQRVEF